MPAEVPAPASISAPVSGSARLDESRRRRLLFRATHRGTHETDILIGGFVASGLDGFDEAELDELEAVMELDDVDLADWLTGRRTIPAAAETPMLRRIEQAARETAVAARTARLARPTR